MLDAAQTTIFLQASLWKGLEASNFTSASGSAELVRMCVHKISIYLSICLSVCLSVCLSIYMSICLPSYLCICPSVCLPFYGAWLSGTLPGTTGPERA